MSAPRAGLTDKPLPADVAAERAVLGAILLDDKLFSAAAEKLKADDFSVDEFKVIFRGMLALREEGSVIDIVTMPEVLARKGLSAFVNPGLIASLVDGVPHLTNLEHYASIVHEKSMLRQMIKAADRIRNEAWEGRTSYDDLYSEFQRTIKASTNGNGNHLHTIEGSEFLMMDTPAIQYVVDPILPTQGLGMLYAWRGCGKTYLTLEICYAIATGQPKCFLWRIPQARRTVYVDGELPINQLQDRWRGIVRAHGLQPPKQGMMNFINRDHDKRAPNIATAEGQRLIEEHLQEGTFLVLDNISALCRPTSGKEDEEGWMSTQEWLIELRHRGITVLLLHHAGKSGAQRGTSKREDFLDAILMMRHPSDYSPDQLLRCEVHCEKYRGSDADAVLPFEVRLESDFQGASVFTHRPLQDVVEKRAVEMFNMGMKVTEIADDLHLSRYQVYRIKKKMGGFVE